MTKRAAAIVVGVLGAAALSVSALLLAHQREAVSAAAPPRGEHAPHGTPEGWTFSWPPGDPARGREVFAKFECWSCHEVQGESFPSPKGADAVGPELAHMGPLHEPEFVAESIIHPNAVIDEGYAAEDGTSKMPSFNDTMTVQEAIDLVAYLAALRPAAAVDGPAPVHNHGRRSPATGSPGHRH